VATIRDEFLLDTSQAERALEELGRQIDRALSGVKLELDTQSFREVDRAFDEIEASARVVTTETQQTADAANLAEVNFRGAANALDHAEDEAGLLSSELREGRGAADGLESAARTVEGQLDQAADEARKLDQNLDRAGRSTGGLNNLDKLVDRIKGGLASLGATLVATFGVRAVGAGLKSAVDSFSALNESINAVNVVFGQAAPKIFAFGETVAKSAGLARSEFQQMSTVLGSALLNVGFSADEVADKTIELTQRAADMASVFNTDVAQALGAIQSALRGETDPIEKFGVSLNAAAVDAQAAALGFSKVEGEFDTTAKAAARLSLILEQTSRVSGDFASTSGEFANASRIAAAEFENLRAELGEALLPAFEAFLALAPTIVSIIEGTLVPAFDTMARSIAGTAEVPPAAPIIDYITTISTAIGASVDAVLGLEDEFHLAFSAITFDFQEAGRQSEQFGQRLQNQIERVSVTKLTEDLALGTNRIDAFGSAVASLIQQGATLSTFEQGFRRLRLTAGLTDDELRTVTKALIEQRAAIGFSAAGIGFLERQLALLNDTQFVTIEAVRQHNLERRQEEEAIDAVINRLGTANESFLEIQRAADGAGLSFEEMVGSFRELAAAGDENAQRLLDSAANLIEVKLSADESRAALKALALAVQTELAPAFSKAADGVQGAADVLDISAKEFAANVRESEAQVAAFEANLALLSDDFPALALLLQAGGSELAGAAAGFLKDIDLAQATEDALTGQDKEIAGAIDDTLLHAAGLVEGDVAAIAILQQLLEGFESNTARAILQPALETLIEQVLHPVGTLANPDIAGRELVTRFGKAGAEAAPASRRVILEALLGPRLEFFPLDDLEEFARTAGFATVLGFDDDSVKTEADAARERLLDRFTLLPFEDKQALAESGEEVGLAWANAIDSQAVRDKIAEVAENLKNVVIRTFRGAFEVTSPSKVMVRLAESLADDFGDAFVIAARSPLQFNPNINLVGLPTMTLRSDLGTLGASRTGSFTGSSGVTGGISLTVQNPIVTDLETSVARGAQLMGAVSGLLGRVTLR